MKNILRAIKITFVLLFAAETALAATGTITGTIIPFSIETSPDSPLSDTATATRTFTVDIGESAQITWYFNGNRENSTSNTTTSSFSKSAGEGTHNVTVVASSENGTVSNTWTWNVQPEPVKRTSSGGGGGGGGIPPLYTDISSPETVKTGSEFNIGVKVDYYRSTEVEVGVPDGWRVSREDGTNNFTIIPSKDAEGNYTIWVNTTTPFNTKTEQVTVNVESEEQEVSYPAISTQREPIPTPTSNTTPDPNPTPTPTAQALESRMVNDIIDKIISGLQAFVGSIFKLFGF